MLKRLLSFTGLAGALALAGLPAFAQTPSSTGAPQLEIIMNSAGQLMGAWVQESVCQPNGAKCVTAIFNSETGEGAKTGDRICSGFEASGNGQEIRRAENAMSKARRLATVPAAHSVGTTN